VKKRAEILSQPLLSPEQRERMFRLLLAHYGNVSRDRFDADLSEKNWVILLTLEDTGEIVGFSTQMLYPHEGPDGRVIVLFSGDTVVEKEHWGGLELPMAFGRMMLAIEARYSEERLYWFLICKGYKTYRYLPVYLREFYPSCEAEPPPERLALMHSLAAERYGDAYDPDAGIVSFGGSHQYVKPGIADVTEELLKDPHVRFFVDANPGHGRGDELVCLAPLHEHNLRPPVVAMLKALPPVDLDFPELGCSGVP
jgi:hypothetical protein